MNLLCADCREQYRQDEMVEGKDGLYRCRGCLPETTMKAAAKAGKTRRLL